MTPSAKNRAGCFVIVASWAVALGIALSLEAWKLMLSHQQRQPTTMLRMLASCWTFPLLAVVIFVALGIPLTGDCAREWGEHASKALRQTLKLQRNGKTGVGNAEKEFVVERSDAYREERPSCSHGF
jgi:hypothetical protein